MANIFDKEHRIFIKLLNDHQVEYLVIGGMAVNLHGYSRGTGDVDIFIGSSSANKTRLTAAIDAFGYDTESFQRVDLKQITMFSLGPRDQPGHIELTNRIDGVAFPDAYKRAQSYEVDGLLMKIIHYDDLIINKLTSARPRDLDDIEKLRRIKQTDTNS